MKNNNTLEVILISKYSLTDLQQKELVKWLGMLQSVITYQHEKSKKLFLSCIERTLRQYTCHEQLFPETAFIEDGSFSTAMHKTGHIFIVYLFFSEARYGEFHKDGISLFKKCPLEDLFCPYHACRG
jgi:hypothetical protein